MGQRFTDSEERHIEHFPIKEGAQQDAFGTSNLDKCSNPLAQYDAIAINTQTKEGNTQRGYMHEKVVPAHLRTSRSLAPDAPPDA